MRISITGVTLLLLTSCVTADNVQHAPTATPLQQLEAGNERSALGRSRHPHLTSARRAEVATGQSPFAVIVSCSDSRVPPELLFDQGLGDLFVIRVAGNVVEDQAIGSIEYAVEHLGPKLVVVLGHERCGAVKAAVDGGEAPGHIGSIVNAIKPAVEETAGATGDRLHAAIRANVSHVVKQLRESQPILANAVSSDRIEVVGMVYDMDTGRVERVP